MVDIKEGLLRHYVDTFASAGLQTIYTEWVKQDEIWQVYRVSYEGNLAPTGGNTRARRYIDGHGYKAYIGEQDAPVADTLYWDIYPIWLFPGERMALEWDQGQAATTIKLNLFGLRYPITPGA